MDADEESLQTGESLSNAVVYTVGSLAPPPELVRLANDLLQGKTGTYPCMDCGPNIRLMLDDDDGSQWHYRTEHDETCPTRRGIVPKPT